MGTFMYVLQTRKSMVFWRKDDVELIFVYLVNLRFT